MKHKRCAMKVIFPLRGLDIENDEVGLNAYFIVNI